MKSHKFWHYLIIAVILIIIFEVVDSFASIYGLSKLDLYIDAFGSDVLILLMLILAIRYAKKTKDNHPRLKACLLFLISSAMIFIRKKFSLSLAITSLLTMYHSNDEIYPYLINASANEIQASNLSQPRLPEEGDSTSFSSNEGIRYIQLKTDELDLKNMETLSYSDSILSVQWTIDKNGIVMSGENKTTGIITIDSIKFVYPDPYYIETNYKLINAQDSSITINGNSQFNETITNNIDFLDDPEVDFETEFKSLCIVFSVVTEKNKIKYSYHFIFENQWKWEKEKNVWVRK